MRADSLQIVLRHEFRLDAVVRLIAAAAAGGLLTLAFEPVAFWPMGFFAVALVAWATLGLGFWAATGTGFVFAATFWLLHIEWLTMYLGAVPWLALGLFMSLEWALGLGLAGWVVSRGIRRLAHPALLAAAWATVWVAREALSSRFPYGGFAWGHISWTQSYSPLLGLSSWIGLPALSGCVVFVSVLPVCWALTWRIPRWRSWLAGAVAVAVWALVPAWGSVTPAQGQLRVAAVQGNANAGLFSNETPGTILRNHLDAAEAVIDDDFDVMVWPENAVDLDVLSNASARAAVSDFVDRMGRPLVLGSVTTRGDEVYNSVIVWLPQVGPTQIYDKRHPVPFAEYMPDRSFWRPLAPDLVDLVPRGFSFGQASGNLDVAGVDAGVLICFETSDSDLVRGLVGGGAQVILAPTNNADFGRSDEAAQQLAITRAQAVAAGRSVVNVSTVSSSAIIDPGGVELASLDDFTSGAMIATVPLHDDWAPSQVLGPAVEAAAVLVTAGALMHRAVVGLRRRGRPGGR